MKELKNRFVSPHLWYFVLAYLDETDYQIVYDNHWERYDKDTGRPVFQLEWLMYEQFKTVVNAATEHFLSSSKEITEENIEKYSER